MSDDQTAKQDPPGGGRPVTKEAKQAKGKSAKPGKPLGKAAAKDGKGGKARGKKAQGEKKDGDSAGPSVAGHARAGTYIRRAKGWGGLGAFVIAAYLSISAGVPTYEVTIRALAAGAAGYLLAWACSVTVWRHLVLAEFRVAVEDAKSQRLAAGEGGGAPGKTPGDRRRA